MFEFINYIDCLTLKFKNNSFLLKIFKNYLNNNKLSEISILGETYRAYDKWSQQTYIGILNKKIFFYLNVENNEIKKCFMSENIYLAFDEFYQRDLIKNEKEYCIKLVKSTLLYQIFKIN